MGPEANFPTLVDSMFIEVTIVSFNLISQYLIGSLFHLTPHAIIMLLILNEYINMLRFFTPYCGERYHLHDYTGMNRQPRGPNVIDYSKLDFLF